MSKTHNKPRRISMRSVFNALVREMGQKEGSSIFEWYCQTYHVDITNDAPATVAWEVFGYC